MRRAFLDLVGREHLPSVLAEKLEHGAPFESIFAVYLGLKDSPEMAAGLERFHASHVCFNHVDEEYLQAVLFSKDDPSAAPPGSHALWIGKYCAGNWLQSPGGVPTAMITSWYVAREILKQP